MSRAAQLAWARRRAAEGLLEVGLPALVAFAAWYGLLRLLEVPAPQRRLTALEVAVLFGAGGALLGHAIGRTTWLLGWRRPGVDAGAALVGAAIVLPLVLWLGQAGFEARCLALGGAVADLEGPVCQVEPALRNADLPGTLLRGQAVGLPWVALWVGVAAALGALGRRDRRLLPSGAARDLLSRLAFLPAAGSESAASRRPGADFVACGSPTLWGEPCGQLYAEGHTPARDQRCVRCQQPFQPVGADRTLAVYSLACADLDALHTWETADSTVWDVDGASQAKERARRSNQRRWVRVATVRVPEILTVAQVLALALDEVRAGSAADTTEDPEIVRARALALARASRVAAWLWFGGDVGQRLVDAQPTDGEVALAVGPTRLADLVRGRAGEVALQLETGLLPLCLWHGRLAGDKVRRARSCVWIPVTGARQDGAWAPRIEGAALLRWLSLPRGQGGAAEETDLTAYEGGAGAREGLEWVRATPGERGEPDPGRREPGDALAEWSWFELKHVELLRQRGVVLVAQERAGEAG